MNAYRRAGNVYEGSPRAISWHPRLGDAELQHASAMMQKPAAASLCMGTTMQLFLQCVHYFSLCGFAPKPGSDEARAALGCAAHAVAAEAAARAALPGAGSCAARVRVEGRAAEAELLPTLLVCLHRKSLTGLQVIPSQVEVTLFKCNNRLWVSFLSPPKTCANYL